MNGKKHTHHKRLHRTNKNNKIPSYISTFLILAVTLIVVSGCIITDSFQSIAQSESGAHGTFYKSITIQKVIHCGILLRNTLPMTLIPFKNILIY